jgi:hypothetical protein
MKTLTVAALAAILTLAGCGWNCDCPAPDPVARGAFDIIDTAEFGLHEGSVDFQGEVFIAQYTDDDGNVWEAEYVVTSEY